MKALLIPEARMMFVSLGADGAPSYTLHHPHHLTQYPQELP